MQPAVGAFDLAFGLRGEGMDYFDTQAAHHLLPLSVNLISLCAAPTRQNVLSPNAVPSLNKSKDTQGVDIVTHGHATGGHQALYSLNMCPSGLLGDKIGIE